MIRAIPVERPDITPHGDSPCDILSILHTKDPQWVEYRARRFGRWLEKELNVTHAWCPPSGYTWLADELDIRKPKLVFSENMAAKPECLAQLAKAYPGTQFVNLVHGAPAWVASSAPDVFYAAAHQANSFPNVHFGVVSDPKQMTWPPGTKVLHIPNIIEIPAGLPKPKVYKKGEPVCVSLVARSVPVKNWGGMVATLGLLSESLSIEALIVGGAGDYTDYFQKHLESAGIAKKTIHFGKWETTLQMVADNVHVGLCCGFSDSLNLIAAEHCLMGIPVVGSTVLDWLPERWRVNPQDARGMALLVEEHIKNKKAGSLAQSTALALVEDNHKILRQNIHKILETAGPWVSSRPAPKKNEQVLATAAAAPRLAQPRIVAPTPNREELEQVSKDPAFFPRSSDTNAKLAIITCHFNWAAYKRPVYNLLKFLREMDSVGIPVYGMELYKAGTEPVMARNPRWLCVEARSEHLLWQKEPMLNRIAKEVPKHIKYIATVDADIHFSNPKWADLSVRALKKTPVIQPFTEAVWVDESGRVELVRTCAARDGLNPAWDTHPGFAWAFHRDFFDAAGLYPWSVTGAGDTAIAAGILGIEGFMPSDEAIGALNIANGVSAEWLRLVRDFMGNRKAGWVEGQVWHDWHGSRANRKYLERHTIMRDIDVRSHVVLNSHGILEWTAQAYPFTREALSQYFIGRREDG